MPINLFEIKDEVLVSLSSTMEDIMNTLLRLSCLVFIPLAAPAAHAQIAWDMATEYPATAMPGEGVQTFASAVARRLEGRLVIRPSFNAEKGFKSAEMLEAVAGGKLQAADAFSGALGNAHPAFGVSALPFLTPTLESSRRLSELARPCYARALAEKGLRLLYVTPWPPSGIWSKNRMTGAVSLNGLAIRTYDANSSAVFDAAGAKAANLSFADVMPKLKDGSVMAVLSSGDGGAGRKLWEFLPHFTAANYAVPLSFAFVSKAAYDALPEGDRVAVDEAANETEARQWATIVGRLEQNYAQMRTNNVQITADAPLDLIDTLQKAAADIIDAWVVKAGPEGKALVETARKP